jgi:OOP family OmpA-OmpF porin
MFRLIVVAAFAAVLAPAPSYAVDAQVLAFFNKDLPGASDSPLTGRYAGSFILARTQKAFDEIKLPSGPSEGASYSNDKKFSAMVTAQGTVTRSIYIAPVGRSSLEVTANFADALAAKGFEPVFRCSGEACGESFVVLKYRWDKPETKVLGNNYEQLRQLLVDAVFDELVDVRYSLFKKTAAEGDTYVAVYGGVHRGGSFGDYSAALADRPGVLLEIVEPRKMDKRMEMVSAEEIGGDLAKQGKAIFYGIQFAFDKADIKPESESQLAEMAKFMKANSQLRAFIIGHTDNKGTLDYNLGLSNKRADSVVKALVTRYGVDGKRMSARGLGPLSPVATNRSEDGQAKNRRVELVEQ